MAKGKRKFRPNYSKPGYKGKAKLPSLPGPPITKDLWGAIDRTGKIVIEPNLEFVGTFTGGLALARQKGKYGFIDPAGKFVVPAAYDAARGFSGGVAPVRVSGKWGFVAGSGDIAVDVRWSDVRDAHANVAFVREGALWGLVDCVSGKLLVKPSFGQVFDWVERAERARTGSATGGGTPTERGPSRAVVEQDTLYGCIDTEGRFVVAPEHRGLYPFSEELAAFATEAGWGYLREDGSVAIPPAFEIADPFSEGVARVGIGENFGYVRKDGSWVVKPELPDVNVRFGEEDASACTAGRIVFADREEGITRAFGFLDASGNVVVKPRFYDLRPLREGLARARESAEGTGFVDADGRFVVKPRWRDAGELHEGRARVKDEKGWGFIDEAGTVVVPCEFEEVDDFAGGLARVRRGGKWGFVAKDGSIAVEPEYELVTPFSEGLAAIRRRIGDAPAMKTALDATQVALAPLLTATRPTYKPFLRLTLTPVDAVSWTDESWPQAEKKAFGQAGSLRSKLGGLPWIPPDGELPRSKSGAPMLLLAQINFATIPVLAGFPSEGLLQLFVEDDPSLGVGEHDRLTQKGFRVLFHPRPASDKALGARLDAAAAELAGTGANLPFPGLAHLGGAPDNAPITIYDHRFDTLVKAEAREALADERVSKAYEDIAKAGGHKIGGYPLFTQEDPRAQKKYASFDTLLLQLDSDGFVEIQDAGVANLFIESDRLAEGDFSRVLWTLDSL